MKYSSVLDHIGSMRYIYLKTNPPFFIKQKQKRIKTLESRVTQDVDKASEQTICG